MFSKQLLREFASENNIQCVLDELRNAGDIVIWGTGLAGTMVKEALDKRHMAVRCFIDSRKELHNQLFQGKPVKGVTEIPRDAVVIIAANVKYGIHERLQKLGHDNYYYIDPVWLHFYDEWIPNKVKYSIEKNYEKIDQLWNWLKDDHSRKVLKNILLHRVIHNLELVWEVYDEHQYFGNNIIRKAGGVFVDCGAFQGDTLNDFMNQVGDSEYKYWAFEADGHNYDVLKQLCHDNHWDHVEINKMAVWSKKDTLIFKNNEITGDVSGKVVEKHTEKGVVVQADSLDNVLADEKVDFIKMDIEGAELEALRGAAKLIKRYKPTLAISAYHELEHLWEVPFLIKEIDDNYDIYFEHHMWNMADTVCYGIYNAGRN